MKISEKLSEIKQKEGELIRAYALREAIIKKQYKGHEEPTEILSQEEIDKRIKQFIEQKRSRLNDVNGSIIQLTQEIIEAKNIINKKNVQLGIDKDLIKIKYLRIELSNLMKIMKSSSYLPSPDYDIDLCDEFELPNKVRKLEREKAKLDASIQFSNWTNDL